jgi:hypothetical protein
MKTKRFFVIPVVLAVAFSTLVALLLFSQSTKAYAQATNPPSLELGDFLLDPTDGVVPIPEAVQATVAFTDPGALGADLTFYLDWGDSTLPSKCEEPEEVEVEPPQCSIDFYTHEIIATHAYQDPGVYALQLTVLYNDEQIKSAIYEYIIAYDPAAGFATGGGWIDSPRGAYQPDPDLAGKATFGFVSKYKKGATTPTGSTEFQFHAADLNFHSSGYQWCLFTGSNFAKFKGVGTINGKGDYKFMIWAGDGEPDTFRIKIWEDESGGETIIYDNGANQGIGGGSIVVHTNK